MNTKKNKVILAIELILIIAGLVLSTMGAIKALSAGIPGTGEEPAMTEMMGSVTEPSAMAEAPAAPEGEEGEMPPINPGMQNGAQSPFSFVLYHVVPVLVYVLLLVYVLVEYRRPHGNLLRATMLIFGLMTAIWSAAQTNVGCTYILPCAAVLIAYLSGRLNKVKKNIVWMVIVGVFLIGYGVVQVTMITGAPESANGVFQVVHCFSAAIQWLALVIGYVSRFEEHKAVGVAADAEAK